MKQSLDLNLKQTLTMTPALQQAIRLLQLSSLDLQTEIQQALESNLMLEADEELEEIDTTQRFQDEYEQPSDRDNEIPENLPVDADWDDVYADGTAPSAALPETGDADYPGYRQANLTRTPDLHSHLIWQADMHPFTAQQRTLAALIIDAIDNNGLLTDWEEVRSRITEDADVTQAAVAAVLATIQAFDPPGVAARDLVECLMIQLRGLPSTTPGRALAMSIVASQPLEQLARTGHAALARTLKTAPADLETAFGLIQTLHPRPGDAFGEQEATYIIPEIFVSRTAAGWQVTLNPDNIPKLRLNSRYLSLVRRADNSADQTTLKAHLQEARFFLHSLKSRNDTLLEVARCIVEAQRAFLEHGEEAMRPLILRDVAEQLEIHESTVSRATANKYMRTPRGLFELKYFFSSQVSTSDGGAASATSIQAMVKRMIATEAPGKPLSDNKLSQMLREQGIRVARRTVAKYREALSIPPSRERRRGAN